MDKAFGLDNESSHKAERLGSNETVETHPRTDNTRLVLNSNLVGRDGPRCTRIPGGDTTPAIIFDVFKYSACLSDDTAIQELVSEGKRE